MSGIRRALFVTTSERYVSLAINFGAVVIVSRLLAPGEIGVSAIGMAIGAIAMSAREFASGTFLVQKPILTRADIRGAFTVMLLMSALIAIALALLAPWLAVTYGEAKLVAFLRIVCAAVLLDAIAAPLIALLRRDMAFGSLAVINIVNAGVASSAVIGLAVLGFSYMSFAYAWAVAAAVSGVLALYFRPNWWVYKPSLQRWRGMVKFGGYNGVNTFLYRLYEAAPTFALSRLVSLDAAGIFNRALFISQLPDKIILGGALPVMLPALSARVRAGHDLTEPYLRAVTLITVLQWPAFIVLAILAHPLVQVLLGNQWLDAVPVVRIIALASLFSFTAELNYPVLVSIGKMRDLLMRGLVAWPLSAVLITCASFFGLTVAALSLIVIIPLQSYISLWFVRRHVPLSWEALGTATGQSSVVAACSAIAPLCAVVCLDGTLHFDISIGTGLVAGAMAAIGWMIGVRLSGHPVQQEIKNIANELKSSLYPRANR